MKDENGIPRPVPDDIRQQMSLIRDSVEQTQAEIRRTRNEVDLYRNETESHSRRTTALWVVVIVLIAAAAVGTWFATPLLQQHRAMFSSIPAVQSALDKLSASATATQQQLGTWANDRVGFSDRLSGLERSLTAGFKAVREETQQMAQQVKRETGQRLQQLTSRVGAVESVQKESSQEVSKLRNELDGVRQELAGVKEQNARQANQISQMEQVQESTRNDVSGLDRRVSSNQAATSAIAHQVDRKRVDFELAKGRTERVADDIYVTVKDTNVGQQRVDGWVQIASDGRFVWLRSEGAQNPVNFASRADSRPYQLVFTRVDRDQASGYLLVPIAEN